MLASCTPTTGKYRPAVQNQSIGWVLPTGPQGLSLDQTELLLPYPGMAWDKGSF